VSLRGVVREGLASGSAATAATTAALAALGGVREGHPAAALNAVSHIVFGPRAARRDDVSAKYTGTGLALNGAAVTGWALLHAALFRRGDRRPGIARAVVEGALVSGLAYLVDYHVVPKRLTPGFEERLPGRDVFALYAVLALCFAFGGRSARA
jgi:hypothetical protein